MSNSLSALDDIRDIFSILHDGRTSTWTGDKQSFDLNVDCDYLAEKIDKSYTSFFIQCEQIDKLEFRPWVNPTDHPQVLTELEEIFKAPLGILSAEIESNYVKITCNQNDSALDYSGGTILLSCKAIRIFDEGLRLLTIDEFDKICKCYWEEMSKEMERIIIERDPERYG